MIAHKGRLAVSEADAILKERHFHNEVWESFKILKKKDLIKKMSDKNPGAGQLIGKGTPRIYYNLTEKGLVALINEGLEPGEFWTGLISYCYYNKVKHSQELDRIEGVYQLFLQKYLKYASGFSYNVLLQLDYFNKMCKKWINDNTSVITLEQKILEILALAKPCDGVTEQEIIRKSKEEPEKVKKVLRRYMPLPFQSFLAGDDEGYFDEQEWIELLSHNIMWIQIMDTAEKHYSLSIFGVMLVLTVVRYHNMNRLNLYLFNKFSIQEAFDIIASNYINKLPYIFGEWHTLKNILKILSVYNFDVIIDEEARSKSIQTSVNMKGYKEYYDGYLGVTMYNRKQMIELYDAGISALNDYKADMNRNLGQYSENSDTLVIYRRLLEIGALLMYNPNSEALQRLSARYRDYCDSFHNPEALEVSILEKSFAHEITFLYYLNLNRGVYFPMLYPQDDYFVMAVIPPSAEARNEFWSRQIDEYSLAPQKMKIFPKSPRERLSAILQRKKHIKNWFSNCIKNSIRFKNEAEEIMSQFYKEIS
jgi:hypothetical protein